MFQKGNKYSLGKAIGHNASTSIFQLIVDFLSGIAALTARASVQKGFVFLAIARDGRMNPGIILWFYGDVGPPLGFRLAECSEWAFIQVNFADVAHTIAVGRSFDRTAIDMGTAAMSTHITHGFASRAKRSTLFIYQDFLLVERRRRVGDPYFSRESIA